MTQHERQAPSGAQGWTEWYARDTIHAPTPTRRAEISHRHAAFLARVINGIDNIGATKVVEIGIGTGRMYRTIHEARPHVNAIALDINPDILEASKQRDQQEQVGGVEYVLANALNLAVISPAERETTIVFHQGTLEHYNDEEMRIMLDEQLRIARAVYISVPSEHFDIPQGLRGDERLMSVEQWKILLSQMDYDVIEAFYYGQNPGEAYQIALAICKKKEKPLSFRRDRQREENITY